MCHGCGILPPNCNVKFFSFKVFLKDFSPNTLEFFYFTDKSKLGYFKLPSFSLHLGVISTGRTWRRLVAQCPWPHHPLQGKIFHLVKLVDLGRILVKSSFIQETGCIAKLPESCKVPSCLTFSLGINFRIHSALWICLKEDILLCRLGLFYLAWNLPRSIEPRLALFA